MRHLQFKWLLKFLILPPLVIIIHPLLIVTGYEASEDKVYKEPLLTDPDEPPPAPVMLAEPAPVAPVTLECSEPAYTEYSEPGQPGRTGGLVSDWLFVRAGFGLVADP